MNWGSYKHQAEPGALNAQRRLPIATLISQVLQVACNHADERGFGYERLTQQDTTWVLARFAIEIARYPEAYDHYLIETWVDDIARIFSSRNFEILDQQGHNMGYARSVWSQLDLKTRRPLDLSSLCEIENYKLDRSCPIDPPSKLPALTTEPKELYRVRYTDIDFNRHVNSSKYIECMLNQFDLAYFDTHHLSRLEIAYLSEATFGDTLLVLCEEIQTDIWLFELRKTDQTALCRAKLFFRNQK